MTHETTNDERNAEFLHPRLVEVYDVECPWSRDDDFFLSQLRERGVRTVLDFGCGTGRLALGLAKEGFRVTGVDPAAASLAAARRKPLADRVVWMEGRCCEIPREGFSAAVMTSHVAQFFVNDDRWLCALRCLYDALAPEGYLLFDSRDPTHRAWTRWNPKDSRRVLALPGGDEVIVWTEVVDVTDDVVTFTHHYRFQSGEALRSTSSLRFRSEEELRTSLSMVGFSIDALYGGWMREPVGEGDGEFLVIARSKTR